MRRWLWCGAAALLLVPACTRHTVKLEPIEIKPIHITMDINIKVNQELEKFFEGVEKQAAEKAPERK